MADGWERDYEEHLKKADRAFGQPLRIKRRKERRRRILRRARSASSLGVVIVLLGGFAYLTVNFVSSHRPVQATDAAGSVAAGAQMSTTTTEVDHRLERRHYSVGNCVFWDDRSQTATYLLDTRVVDCEAPHVLEVTGRESIQDRQVKYPDKAFWDAYFESGSCLKRAEDYLKGRLDPHGRYYTHGVLPSPESWADGDREVYCGIGRRSDVQADIDVTGTFPSTGRVRLEDQYLVRAIGSCIPPQGDGLASGTVPCDAPHEVEISGHVDLTGRDGTVPTDDQFQSLVSKDCERLGRGYAKSNFRDPVYSGWLPIEPATWDAGGRTVECTVAEYRNDETVTITRRLGA